MLGLPACLPFCLLMIAAAVPQVSRRTNDFIASAAANFRPRQVSVGDVPFKLQCRCCGWSCRYLPFPYYPAIALLLLQQQPEALSCCVIPRPFYVWSSVSVLYFFLPLLLLLPAIAFASDANDSSTAHLLPIEKQ